VHDFSAIEEAVSRAGLSARNRQKELEISIKKDGSVLTQVDLATEKLLTRVIRSEFPEANIVSEEYPSEFRSGRELTFTIDPIDGTDSYSQGMPGWCVAVGILDSSLEPVGGIIAAPRWGVDADRGVFVSALPGGDVKIRGAVLNSSEKVSGAGNQLLVGSKVHRRYDISRYPGKIRSFGSSVLHILSPLIHSAIEGALIPPAYIWDIAAAHGLIRRYGLILEYMNGSPIRYQTMVHRQLAAHHMVCGTESVIRTIRKHTCDQA